MDQNLPFSEPSKSFGIGPPPPDIVNPLDRLARRPRLAPHLTPPFPLPFSAPHLSAAQDTMSLNFAPPPRSKINSHNTSTSLLSDKHMKDSNESSLMNEQGECHRLVYMVLCVSHTLSFSLSISALQLLNFIRVVKVKQFSCLSKYVISLRCGIHHFKSC